MAPIPGTQLARARAAAVRAGPPGKLNMPFMKSVECTVYDGTREKPEVGIICKFLSSPAGNLDK